MNVRMHGLIFNRVTRTWIYQHVMVLQDQIRILPVVEMLQIVGAHDQAKFMIRISIPEAGKRIDGVGWPGKLKFNVGRAKTLITVNGAVHHLQPVMILQQMFLFLQGILRTDHKPELFDVRKLDHVVGDGHVADMNGIKCSEI